MTDNNTNYPAGWYPDQNALGTERYYDGTTWTTQTRPLTAAAPAAAATSGKRPWYKRKGIVIPVGIVAGIILISGISSAISGPSDTVAEDKPVVKVEEKKPAAEEEPAAEIAVPDTTGLTAKEAQAVLENAGLEVKFSAASGVVLDRDNWTVLSTTPAAGATAAEGDTVVVNVEKILTPEEQAAAEREQARANMTVSQQSALSSADSYMRSIGGFSRQGLIDQLVYEKFSVEDATFATDSGGFDWMASAADSAASYMKSIGGFSRGSLIDQLMYEGFSQAEAEHGVASVGL